MTSRRHFLAAVTAGGTLAGLRESRHIVAQYRVTSKDVLYGRSFDDCN